MCYLIYLAATSCNSEIGAPTTATLTLMATMSNGQNVQLAPSPENRAGVGMSLMKPIAQTSDGTDTSEGHITQHLFIVQSGCDPRRMPRVEPS